MKKMGILAAAAAMTAGSLSAAEGIELNKLLTLSGFIDTSYVMNDIDEPAGATTSSDTATFGLDQAEIDLHFYLAEGLTGRVDLAGGNEVSAVQNLTGVTGNLDDVEIEQARIDVNFGTWSMTLGKWDTFIGLEAIEPTEMFQDTNSLTFALEPSQQTGIAFNYDSGMWNFKAAVVNGLGVYNPDNNDEFGFQFHLGVRPWETLGINLNYAVSEESQGTSYGTEVATGSTAEANLLTLDVQYARGPWIFGLEYVSRDVDVTGGGTIEDTAWMAMLNYTFGPRWALTARYSVNEGTTGGDMTEFTVAPIMTISDNWSAMLEYRSESVDTTYAGSVTGFGAGADANRIALKTILKF